MNKDQVFIYTVMLYLNAKVVFFQDQCKEKDPVFAFICLGHFLGDNLHPKDGTQNE